MLIALVAIWVVAIPATVVVGAWALAVYRERREERRRLVIAAMWSAGLHPRRRSRRPVATPWVRRGCAGAGRPTRTRSRGVWPT